jgi:hypothetical protein
MDHHNTAPHFDKILADSFNKFINTAGDILSDDRLNRLLLTDSKPVEVVQNVTKCKWIIEAGDRPTAGKYWIRNYTLIISILCDGDILDQVATYQLSHDLSKDILSYRHDSTQFICCDNDGEPNYIESWYVNESQQFHTIQLVPF